MSEEPSPASNPPQLPAELRHAIIKLGSVALDGIVEPEHQARVVDAILGSLVGVMGFKVEQRSVTRTEHSGPLPAPSDFGEYEKVLPGSADRMLTMAEKDQAAYIGSNQRSQAYDLVFKLCCLIAGMAALGVMLYFVVRLAENGHELGAAGVAALGITGVIGAFVNARMNS